MSEPYDGLAEFYWPNACAACFLIGEFDRRKPEAAEEPHA